MKVNIWTPNGINSGKLKETPDKIDIRSGRWILQDCSNPMEFNKIDCFEQKHTYFLFRFGERLNNNGKKSNDGEHIKLNWYQNQKFLLLQNKHWFQQEGNIRYIINLIFLTGGLILAFYKK